MKKINNTLIVFASKTFAFKIFGSWMGQQILNEVASDKSYLVKITLVPQSDSDEARMREVIKEFVAEEFPEFY